jgi:hypothetical protein
MYKKLFLGSAIVASTLTLNATEIADLNKKLDALTEEIAQIKEAKSGSSALDKLSIGGYGKMDYTKYQDSDNASKLDLYRAILYVGYQFTDDIKFVSEIEWEHGGREKTGGYGIMEQAYLDFKLANAASLKLGHVIVPVGMVNLYHEPTSFHSVSRPEVEKYIIPSTWHENGAIVHGKVSDFDYQVGMLASLNSNNGTEVRGMRQHGQKSKAEDFAFVARADYKSTVGVNVGASVFSGKSGQGNAALSEVKTTIAEIHAGYNLHDIHINGLYAQSKVDNAVAVAIDHNSTASGKGSGFYVTAAYDVTDKWTPFIQYEKYNRFDETFSNTGASTGAGNDIVNTTIGVNYFPTKNVVLKANYIMRDNKGTDDDMIQLGTGYVF